MGGGIFEINGGWQKKIGEENRPFENWRWKKSTPWPKYIPLPLYLMKLVLGNSNNTDTFGQGCQARGPRSCQKILRHA